LLLSNCRYTLDQIPNVKDGIKGKLGNLDFEGIISVKSGNSKISLFPGALYVLQEFYSGNLSIYVIITL
jgi:hypothetical protein